MVFDLDDVQSGMSNCDCAGCERFPVRIEVTDDLDGSFRASTASRAGARSPDLVVLEEEQVSGAISQ